MSEDTSTLINLDRLFSRTFSQRILGERLGMDLYGRNGFRLISISALTDKTETEHAIGKVQGRLRLRLRRKGADPDEVLRQTAMGLGYEQYIKLERPLEMLERPREIRRRICDELFWPHVRGRQGAELEEFGSIASKEIRDYFESSTVASDRAQARRLHALAVAYHNYALAEETAFIKGQGAWPEQAWRKALDYWAQALKNDHFWTHMSKRIEAHDDIRLRPDHLEEIREILPTVVLAFNAQLALAYSHAGHLDTCARHMDLILAGAFPESAKREAIRPAASAMIDARLMPIVSELRAKLKDPKSLTQQALCDRIETAFSAMEETSAYFTRDLGVSPEAISGGAFDDFCAIVMDALSGRTSQEEQRNRLRVVLMQLLFCSRMQRLPLSEAVGARAKNSMRDSRNILYEGNTALPQKFDPAMCWFIPTEYADPMSSIILATHKITDTSGGNIRWRTVWVAIPRSKLAADFHNGRRQKANILEELRNKYGGDAAEQLRVLRKRRDALQAEIAAKYQPELVAVEQTRDREIEQCKQASTDEERAVLEQLDKLRKKFKEATAELTGKLQAAMESVQKKYSGQLDAVQQAAAKARALSVGKIAVCYMPPMLLFLAGFLGFAQLWARSSYVANPTQFVMIAGILGVCSGIATGYAAMASIRGRAASAVARVEQKISQEKAQYKSKHDAAYAKLEGSYSAQASKLEAKLGGLRAVYEGIKNKANKKISDIEARKRNEFRSASGFIDTEIKQQEKLLGSLEPKAENAKHQFPAYAKVKSDGYKDGEEPSKRDLEVIQQRQIAEFQAKVERYLRGISEYDRQMLALMQQALPEDKFAAMLIEIVEGRQSLAQLMRGMR